MKNRWIISEPITKSADEALSKYPPVLRQLLFNREIENAERAEKFLAARRPEDSSPFDMLDMKIAVDRIAKAIRDEESIIVYGDYDADGVTATTLMVQTLKALGGEVLAFIPNRFEHGYGLNNQILSGLKAGGASLIITVDCGIRAVEQAAHARDLGLDLIITDHHGPGPEIPDAFAVINPKRPDDPYPDKNLAGVGIAFKLASALIEYYDPPNFDEKQILDLVAIGTVADLVPLVGENRALVKAGVECIRRPQRQGLISLMGVAGLRPGKVSAMDIGFTIGPRINAAGRLDSAFTAYEMLISDNVFETASLAQKLDNQNRERQKITGEMQELAQEMVEQADEDQYLIFAAHPDFNPGVVGLAASRLADQHYRPAIVAHRGEENTRASCRSIPEFHITNALDACSDLLLHHGGHAAAAGFTVANENVDELVARLQEIAREVLEGQDLQPTLIADVEVPLQNLDHDLLRALDWLQPTGFGNRQPAFVTRNLKVHKSRPVGRDQSHLKMTVTDGQKYFDAIAFRQGHWHQNMPPRIDLLYNFEQNEFNGRVTLQLNVRDIKPSRG